MTYEAIYKKAIANGCSPAFADMLASQQPPGTRGTDRAFMQGRNNNEDLNRMHKSLRNDLLETARKAGVSVSGKTYCSGLARYAHDPSAWVSSNDEIVAKCKQNGWDCKGSVNYTPPDPPLALPRIRELKAKKRPVKQ